MSTYDRIADLCKKKGISVTGLETELGFGRGSLGKMKKGGSTSVARLQKIADYFEVGVNELMDESDSVQTDALETYYYDAETMKLAETLRSLQCENIKKNDIAQIKVIDTAQKSLYGVLGDNFELSETPKKVEKYMKNCNERCICLDIGENKYLPCQNALILSKQNCLDSFTAFCHDIDPKDPFVTRMRLREASEQLNNYEADTSISVSDYIHNLRK